METIEKLRIACQALENIRNYEPNTEANISPILQYRLVTKRLAGSALIDVRALTVDKDGKVIFVGVE